MWIEEFRKANGYTREQLSRALGKLAHRRGRHTACPPELIYMLETIPGTVTHPGIANLIAEATGATPEQRDSIVHKMHRGKWKPPRIVPLKPYAPPRPKPAPPPPQARKGGNDTHKRPCGAVDREGNVIARFESVNAAARAMGVAESTVYNRCRGATPAERAFFSASHRNPGGDRPAVAADGLTFRYLDASGMPMDPRQAMADRTPVRTNQYKAIVEIDARGRVLRRYESTVQAAEANDIMSYSVYDRCRRKLKRDEFAWRGVSWRYAQEWDLMDEAARAEDARRTLEQGTGE